MVVDATGQISGLIELADAAAKKCSGRSIPIHPDLAAALHVYRPRVALARMRPSWLAAAAEYRSEPQWRGERSGSVLQ
jgi:hypothetical protein